MNVSCLVPFTGASGPSSLGQAAGLDVGSAVSHAAPTSRSIAALIEEDPATSTAVGGTTPHACQGVCAQDVDCCVRGTVGQQQCRHGPDEEADRGLTAGDDHQPGAVDRSSPTGMEVVKGGTLRGSVDLREICGREDCHVQCLAQLPHRLQRSFG